MRAYIDGRLSENNEKISFLLSDLWFSNKRFYDDLDDCIRISGCICETSGNGFDVSTRWKGVEYQPYDGDDEELNSINRLKELIKGKYLVNAEAYFDKDVDFYIDTIKFVQGNNELIIPNDMIEKEIEFIYW